MNILSANTILYSDRFDDCVAFYAALPGFEIAEKREWFVEFAVGGAFLSVANARRTSLKAGGADGITLTFRVADADAAHAALAAGDFTTTNPVNHPWGARTFYVFDPDGRRIEFWSADGD